MQRLFNSLVAGILFLSLNGAQAGLPACSFKATASSKDSLVKETNGSAYHATVTSASYLKAVLPLSEKIHLTDPNAFSLKIGNATFSATNWTGSVSVTGRAATNALNYYFYETGATNPLATINVAWKTNSMTVTATFTKDIFGITNWAAFPSASGDAEVTISNKLQATFAFANASVTRSIPLTGRDTRLHKTAGGQTFPLHSISISGAADMTPPYFKITSPSTGITISNAPTLTSFKGTVTDASGISSMYAEVHHFFTDTYESCDLITTTNYSNWIVTNVPPVIGTNLISIHAFDSNNNESVAYATVIYQVLGKLTILTEGKGSVSFARLGRNNTVQMGTGYKVTLSPNAGWILADWAWYCTNADGSYGTTFDYGWSNNFDFRMPGTNNFFKATFIPTPCATLKGNYTGGSYSDYNWIPGYANYTNTDNSTNFGRFNVSITTNGYYSGSWTRRTNTLSFNGRLYAETRYSLPAALDSQLNSDWKSTTNIFYIDSYSTKPKFWLSFDNVNTNTFSGAFYEFWYSAEGDGYDADQYGYLTGYKNRITTTNVDAGNYNIVLTKDGSTSTTNEIGNSFAIARVSANGTVSMSLYPADGITHPLTTTSYQANDGSFLFFSSLYSRGGLMGGWLTITNGAVSNYTNSGVSAFNLVHWTKQTNNSAYYPNGFTNNLIAAGSKYVAPQNYAYSWIPGTISLGSSNTVLASADLSLVSNRPKVASNTYGLTFSVSPANGLVSGEFAPTGGTKTSFNGLVIDNDIVAGYFKNSDKTTGWMKVEPTLPSDSGGLVVFSGAINTWITYGSAGNTQIISPVAPTVPK